MDVMSEPTLNERVAEEIRVWIARRNISATELARRAGMTQRSISRRITGEKAIDMDDLQRIATALEVDIADLIPAPARRETGLRGPSSHATGKPTSSRLLAQGCLTKWATTTPHEQRESVRLAPSPRKPATQKAAHRNQAHRPAWTCTGVTA